MCGRLILGFYLTSNVSALGIPSSQPLHANSMTVFRLLTCGGGSQGMAFPGAVTVPGQWSGASVRMPCSPIRSGRVSLRDFSEVQGEKRHSPQCSCSAPALVANPVTPTITTPMFSAARLAPTVAAHSTAPGPAAASSGFGLTDDHPSANARHYAFMLEALRDVQESLTRRGIKFVVQKGAPSEDVRRHRNLRKNWRMSPTRRSGASWAAQWLPLSNSLQETMLAWSRSANLRMGRKS
jgi:hypothetical protein